MPSICCRVRAHKGNGHPAGKSKSNRLASCFYQFYHICVNSDSRHGHNDKELAQLLEETEDFIGGSQDRPGADRGDNCGNDGGGDEIEYECGEYVFQADRLPFPAFLSFPSASLQKASISETGMIASVRVSFTMVAYSNTAPFVPCSVSQVEAAAVTEEVSLTAVPAKSPKPVSSQPKHLSQRGKISAAITLKEK